MNMEDEVRQSEENEKYVDRPIVIVVAVLILIIGCLVYFGIKDKAVLICVRDLIITLFAFFLFLLGTAAAVLCFFLTGRIGSARDAISNVLKNADVKIEELAEQITDILKKILEPFVKMESKSAGLLGIFKKNKSEK